ncbi:MAG: hypothetical protein EHM35_01140 [Planctomycetaceae bacterium]|nr:MAG: hypothetical protein EHM35_01140 [Planctomycetaceae bacterium]
MATVTVSKHLRVLGTGSLVAGATSITGWTPGAGVLTPMVGRNIWITMTSSTHIGQGFRTKVVSDGASLGIRDPSPFAT